MKLKDFIKNIILAYKGAGCSGIIDLDIGVSYTDADVPIRGRCILGSESHEIERFKCNMKINWKKGRCIPTEHKFIHIQSILTNHRIEKEVFQCQYCKGKFFFLGQDLMKIRDEDGNS